MRLEKYLSPQAIAEALAVGDETVRRWIDSGDLPAIKVGQNWRVSESVYRTWLASKNRLDDQLVEKR